MAGQHYYFITGRLAEASLRGLLEQLGPLAGFDYSIGVMPIAIAALITPKWAARRVEVPGAATRVMVPGYCQGDLAPLEQAAGVAVERGPKDLKELPDYFGQHLATADYGQYEMEILARIARAGQWPPGELLREAKRLEADAADLIVLGCDPGQTWSGVGEAVGALRDEGHRVAIESRNPVEIEPAIGAGAELVLSVDSSNRNRARDWGCEVVVAADALGTLAGMEETVAMLQQAGVGFRINPGLQPIAFGFAESLGRHMAVRWQWPKAEMIMDLASLSETTEVDSAAMHVVLLGFCEELEIRSVLVGRENNWTRSAVQECNLARQLVHYAVRHRVLPKQLEPGLLMLRDAKLVEHSLEELQQLAGALKDPSYRIFLQGGRLHVVAADLHLEGTDPYDLFERVLAQGRRNVDPAYAFYLGYEMAKAVTALTLGKNYRQDDALEWGMLTVRELSVRERRALRLARRRKPPEGAAADEEPCE